MDVSLKNKHPAGVDADAASILFSKLLLCDQERHIDQTIKKTAQDQCLSRNLAPDDFLTLPERYGVYYFHNTVKTVIYVGKAVDVKKRVASHLACKNLSLQRQNFSRKIHSVLCEICATELMALVLECVEIKKLWTAYNLALKRFMLKHGI